MDPCRLWELPYAEIVSSFMASSIGKSSEIQGIARNTVLGIGDSGAKTLNWKEAGKLVCAQRDVNIWIRMWDQCPLETADSGYEAGFAEHSRFLLWILPGKVYPVITSKSSYRFTRTQTPPETFLFLYSMQNHTCPNGSLSWMKNTNRQYILCFNQHNSWSTA